MCGIFYAKNASVSVALMKEALTRASIKVLTPAESGKSAVVCK